MNNQNQSFTTREKYLKMLKKHKKNAARDSIIVLLICSIIIVFYQLAPYLEERVDASNRINDDSVLSISMVGDIMLGRYLENIIDHHGIDYPFKFARHLFEQTDIVTGNFEHPILTRDESYYEDEKLDKRITLFARPVAAEAVYRAGFTNVNLANDHASDYGARGVIDTLETFRSFNLPTVGAGININKAREIHYEEINGLTIATLGFSDAHNSEKVSATLTQAGVTPLEAQYFIPDISAAKREADLVIVHTHWGNEYDNAIQPRQREMAYAMVEAGADLIIGHHAHVLQPIEVYHDAVILYGLGNFIFDQGWSMTRETAVIQYRLFEDRIRLEVHPMYIEEGQPRPVHNRYRQEKIFSQLTEELIFSPGFNEYWDREGGKLVREIQLGGD